MAAGLGLFGLLLLLWRLRLLRLGRRAREGVGFVMHLGRILARRIRGLRLAPVQRRAVAGRRRAAARAHRRRSGIRIGAARRPAGIAVTGRFVGDAGVLVGAVGASFLAAGGGGFRFPQIGFGLLPGLLCLLGLLRRLHLRLRLRLARLGRQRCQRQQQSNDFHGSPRVVDAFIIGRGLPVRRAHGREACYADQRCNITTIRTGDGKCKTCRRCTGRSAAAPSTRSIT
jgi:hypothetical protein